MNLLVVVALFLGVFATGQAHSNAVSSLGETHFNVGRGTLPVDVRPTIASHSFATGLGVAVIVVLLAAAIYALTRLKRGASVAAAW